MTNKPKLIRITTVPLSLHKLLKGQMKFMSQYFDVTGVSSPGKLLETVAREEGIQTVGIEMTRQITPMKDLMSLVKMYRFLKKEKPYIVHTHTPKAGIVGLLAAFLARVPNRLHTVAGMPLMEVTGFKLKILRFVEKFTYSCATTVYVNSKGLLDFILENRFCSPAKLKILGQGSSNGIDTAYFDPSHYSEQEKANLRHNLNIDSDDFVFIFIGRIVADKGINELVAAFKQVASCKLVRRGGLQVQRSRFNVQGSEPVALSPSSLVSPSPNLPLSPSSPLPLAQSNDSKLKTQNSKLLLVGPFEQELDPLLPETISKIDNNPSIIHVGYQDDVRPYLAIADALVFPSYREGFPNVVMQAGAMGLPSIVSDINGCNEIIVEGENGVIIPPKDEEALLKAMQSFLMDMEQVKSMALSARPMIESRYEQKVVWEALLEEYRELENRYEV